MKPTRTFSDLYRRFEDAFRGSPASVRSRQAVYLDLVEGVSASDRSALLAVDIGSGRGEWLSLLGERGWRTVGIEPNAGMAAEAQAQGLAVAATDALTHLRGLADGSAALVTAFHVVEHVDTDYLIAMLSEVERVLAPGGFLILETPNPENLRVGASSFYLDPTHVRPIPPGLLRFLVGLELPDAAVVRLNSEPVGGEASRGERIAHLLLGASRDYAVVAQKRAGTEDGTAVRLFAQRHSEDDPADRRVLDGAIAAIENEGVAREGRLAKRIEALEAAAAEAGEARDQAGRQLEALRTEGSAGIALVRTALREAEQRHARDAGLLRAEMQRGEEAGAQLRRALDDALASRRAFEGRIDAHIADIRDRLAHMRRSDAAAHAALRAPAAEPLAPAEPSPRLPSPRGDLPPGSDRPRRAAMSGGPHGLEDPVGTLEWLWRGASAWILLKPGSRPRRIGREAAALGKRLLGRFRPGTSGGERRAGLRDEFRRATEPPPFRGEAAPLAEPYGTQIAHRRLAYAVAARSRGAGAGTEAQDGKPRLAYVSPLPPERSGIADYSARVLPFLFQHYAIDVIIAQEHVTDPWITANCQIRTSEWFSQNAHLYDRVMYHVGNSLFHSHIFPLLEVVPGVVVLHDFFLGNVLGQLELHGGWTGFWTAAIVRSHGPEGLIRRYTPSLLPSVIANYPANFPVLDQAQGVIAHSRYSRDLCRVYYPAYDASGWAVIPLARPVANTVDKAGARAALGIPDGAFVVCSFGYAQQNKMSRTLVDAWMASALYADRSCRLYLVGECSPDEYGARLRNTVEDPDVGGRMSITGYVSDEVYALYLAAADAGVQLRTQSRGETSAAVLDCLAHGLPTIVNAHGAMAELPADVVCGLPDDFATRDLAEALTRLWADPPARAALASAARRHILERHAPAVVAEAYRDAIERFAGGSDPLRSVRGMVAYAERSDIAPDAAPAVLARHAGELRRESPLARPALQLLFDVSALVREDLRTGIQRVVRAQLAELMKDSPLGYRVEPVWLNNDFGTWRYHYANKYVLELSDCPDVDVREDPIEFGEGDVFFGADFFAHGVVGAAKYKVYEELRLAGVRLCFSVYDILPLTMPQYFPPASEAMHLEWLGTVCDVADRLVCISQGVKSDVERWLDAHPRPTNNRPRVYACPLGADIEASAPSFGLPPRAEGMLNAMAAGVTFLMVGTVEPRKAHLQVLRAFEALWQQGVDVNLVVVGNEGWKGIDPADARNLPATVRALEKRARARKRFWWISGASDEFLAKVYAASSCLIAASYGEGYGLPLVEASRHRIPILARDIPVFREVVGASAFFFSGETPEAVAEAVKGWLRLRREGRVPPPDDVRWHSWAENVRCLRQALLDDPLG